MGAINCEPGIGSVLRIMQSPHPVRGGTKILRTNVDYAESSFNVEDFCGMKVSFASGFKCGEVCSSAISQKVWGKMKKGNCRLNGRLRPENCIVQEDSYPTLK